MLRTGLFRGRARWIIAGALVLGVASLSAAEPGTGVLKEEGGGCLLIAALLVFFMQAGFALLETGLSQARNAGNVAMKIFAGACLGPILFLAVGYALLHGTHGGSFAGWDAGLLPAFRSENPSALLYECALAALPLAIVSGAMAERTRFAAHCLFAGVLVLFLYPVAGHWIRGGGWLSELHFRDAAGATAIHSLGAWCALAGCVLLGPRIGKYGRKGRVNVIPGHNMPLAALGVFLLWFSWYGLVAGLSAEAPGSLAPLALATTLGGAMGANGAMLCTWLRFGKPDLSMTLSGVLAGLVATAGCCASVPALYAALVGLVAGVLVVESCRFVERRLRIDDPVGAVSVHGVCGVWGTLAVGLFGEQAIDSRTFGAGGIQDGLFAGGGFHQLGVQALGVLGVFGFVSACALIVFLLLRHTVGLRVSEEEEVAGLDLSEHGGEAYPDFMPVSGNK